MGRNYKFVFCNVILKNNRKLDIFEKSINPLFSRLKEKKFKQNIFHDFKICGQESKYNDYKYFKWCNP